MKEDDKATLSKEENPVFDSKVETSDKMLKKTPISPYNQVNSSINLEPGAWMKLLASTDGKDKIVKALSYWGLSFVWTLSETEILAHAVQGDSLNRSLYTSTVTLHESRRLFHFGSFFKMLLAPSNADTMNPCVRWITIMKSFLEDFALFLNSDTLLHTKFVGAVVRQPKVIWVAILLLKLFLIGVELNALVRRLLHQSWGIVMHMKHFRCSNPRGCNNRFPPCWSLKTTNMDPNHSCGGRMSDSTAATSCPMQTVSAMCRRCGNNLPIDALKRDLSMQGQEISIWTIPYVLRYLQGFFWLMGYKKCEFHAVFWRIIELLCEAVSGMARLLYRDLEPFSPLRNSFDPVPRQRLIVILGALISSYLSLKRLLN